MISFLLGALIAASLSTSTVQAQATHAGATVVAYDDRNDQGKGHHDNGKRKGQNKHGEDENENLNGDENDQDNDFHRRWNSLRGCVTGVQSNLAFAMQTRLGLITIEPTGNARRAFDDRAFELGQIVVAHGYFAGNGVYLADRVNAAGNAQGGRCPYRTNTFPQPGYQQPGVVNVSGTIASLGGNVLQLNTGKGYRTVYFTNSTLVEYSNGAIVGTQNLHVGESVAVYGQPSGNGNGTINAGTIVIQSGLTTGNAVVTGLATGVDLGAGRLTIFSGLFKSTTVVLTQQTIVRRGGAVVDRSQLHSGELVTVYGDNSGGTLVANTININN